MSLSNNRRQCAKRFISNSPGQVDFAVKLVVDSVFHLLDGQMRFFWKNILRKFKLQMNFKR